MSDILKWVKKKFGIRRKLELHEAFQTVFTSPQGQLVLEHIIKEGFVLKSTFVVGDSHSTALNEGSRRLALSILKFVNKSHDSMIKQLEKTIQDNEN